MTTLQYLDDAPDGYRAGACNIGPAEIARRRLLRIHPIHPIHRHQA